MIRSRQRCQVCGDGIYPYTPERPWLHEHGVSYLLVGIAHHFAQTVDDLIAIRPAVLLRDPVCRCDGCPRCRVVYVDADETRCVALSSDCDHLDDPNDHSLANLRGLCRPCHGTRARAER